jgi:hypothetical protein
MGGGDQEDITYIGTYQILMAYIAYGTGIAILFKMAQTCIV